MAVALADRWGITPDEALALDAGTIPLSDIELIKV